MQGINTNMADVYPSKWTSFYLFCDFLLTLDYIIILHLCGFICIGFKQDMIRLGPTTIKFVENSHSSL